MMSVKIIRRDDMVCFLTLDRDPWDYIVSSFRSDKDEWTVDEINSKLRLWYVREL